MSGLNGGYSYFSQVAQSNIMPYILQTGCMKKQQAYMMVPEKHHSTVDKIIYHMTRNKSIFQEGTSDYYRVNPFCHDIDYEAIRCLWVLLDLKKTAQLGSDDYWLMTPTKPSVLSFVKSNVQYDLIPYNSGEEVKVRAIENMHKEEMQIYPDTKHKYIFVCPDESVVDVLPEIEAPNTIAVVNELSPEEMNLEKGLFVEISYFE